MPWFAMCSVWACTFNTRQAGNGLVSFACVLTNDLLESVCICFSIDLTELGPFARRFSVSTAPQPNRRYKLASLLKRRGGQSHSALSPNAECDLIRHATPICAPAHSSAHSQQQQQPAASPPILLRTRAVREEQERLDAEFARQLQEGLDMTVESSNESLHGAGGNRSISHASPKASVGAEPNLLRMNSGAAAAVTPVSASLADLIVASPLPSECEGPRSARKTKQPHNRPLAAKSHVDAVLDTVFRLHCSPHQRHRSSHAAAATQPEPLRASSRLDHRNTTTSKSNQIAVPHGEQENVRSISGLSELDAIRLENEQLRESLASMRVPPSPRTRANAKSNALETVPSKRTKPSLIDRLRCGIEALGCAASSSNASVASPFKIHHASKPEAFSGF